MTKVHFIALADVIRADINDFHQNTIDRLADFCEAQSPRFDRERWLNYIAGTHTANGRKL